MAGKTKRPVGKKPPVNALAPEPVNSLYDPSDLYNWLQRQESLPAWSPNARPSNPAATASFFPAQHRVVARRPTDIYSRASLAHEMTHAAQNVLEAAARNLRERQWQNETLTPKEQQFLDGYLQLMGDLPGRVGQYDRVKQPAAAEMVRKNADALGLTKYDNDPQYKSYRGQPIELQAFGVGDTTFAEPGRRNQPNHLNPTFATEFTLLKSLFDQLPETTRKSARKTPRTTQDTMLNYVDPFAR